MRTSNTFPCSFVPGGGGGGGGGEGMLRAGSFYGARVGIGSGVGPEGWFAHPLGGVECRGHAQCPAFAPGSSEVAVGLFDLFVSCCP